MAFGSDRVSAADATESDNGVAAGSTETGVQARSRMVRRRRRTDVALIAGALVVLLGSSLLLAFTIGYAPDEGSHRLVVDHFAHDLAPMTWEDFEYGAARGHPYHLYSPVPYIPYLPTARIAEVIGPVDGAASTRFVARTGGLFVATAQFFVTIGLVRRMLRGRTLRQSVAVAFTVNLVPQLRFLHAYMNADAVTVLVGTACALVALRVLQRARVGIGDAALVGSMVGLAALSRYHALIMAVLPMGALLWRVARDAPTSIRTRLRLLGLAAAVAAVLGLPSQLAMMSELANGHVTASGDHEALRVDTFVGRPIPPVSLGALVDARLASITKVWSGVWADVPGVVSLAEFRAARWVAVIFVVLGSIGLLLPTRRVLSRSGRAIALGCLGAVSVTLAAMSLQWPFDLAGRFLLPAGVPFLCGAVLGTGELASRVPKVRHALRISVLAWMAFTGSLLIWVSTKAATA